MLNKGAHRYTQLSRHTPHAVAERNAQHQYHTRSLLTVV